MSNVKIFNSPPVLNMPWQDAPAGEFNGAPIWRYSENPIIGRNPVKGVARIFNSAVVPYEGKFIGVFRGEQVNGIPFIYLGHSEDAIHWTFDEEKIHFVDDEGKDFMPVYAYDPRLVKIDDTYYLIWCQDAYGAAIGMAKTTDFKTFTRIPNPFLPFNRNAVLFPRKIHDKYMMLSRPSDSGHTPFGDIYISESPDMVYWGRHRHVMGKSPEWWESVKIGGGAAPIETSEGWLLFYHGVTGTCNGFAIQSAVPSSTLTSHRKYCIVVKTSFSLLRSGMRKEASYRTLPSHVPRFMTVLQEELRFIMEQLIHMSHLHLRSSTTSLTTLKCTAW